MSSTTLRRLTPAALALSFAVAACTTTTPHDAPPAAATAPAPVATAPVAALSDQPVTSRELLDAVLWTQTAVEHDVSCRQAYALAADRLELALADPTWTAAIEQSGDFSKLPPAVIFDADETIIDNGPFEAQLVKDGKEYTSELWREWVARGDAAAIPGALEFTGLLKRKGVEVFVISNRHADFRKSTVENLVTLGFPIRPDGSNVMLRAERPEWTNEKASRRSLVAATHRILLLVGDDLGDFMPGVEKGPAPEERVKMVDSKRELWARRWILLPNPMYGSWERALLGDAKDSAEKLRRRYARLRAMR